MERPIDEVASEYVVLLHQKPSMFGKTDVTDRVNELYEELQRRCGPDHSNTHLQRAQYVYDLLNPNT